MSNRSKPKIAVVLLLGLLAVGSIVGWLNRGDPAADGRLVLYGNIDLREVALAFMVQDRIIEQSVDEGSVVSAGQLLARVEPVRFQATVDQLNGELEQAKQKLAELVAGTRPQEIDKARADVAAAEANSAEAQSTYKRKLKLVKQSAASQQDVDDALGAMGVMRGQLDAARETLDLAIAGPREERIAAQRGSVQALEGSLMRANKDLTDTRLLAPADGVIRSRLLQTGDIGGPTRPVFTLAKLDPVWIRTYLPETELGRVREGMAASISTDSFPGKSYPGWVGYISPSAEFTPKNVETPELRTRLVYQVWVYACNPSRELRLGMPATVTIELAGDSPPAGDCKPDQPPVASAPASASAASAANTAGTD